MLPFLKNSKDASASSPVESIKRESDGGEDHDYGLESCGHDILEAIKANDAAGIGAAIKAAFDILDSQPHKEGPHV